MPSDRREDRVTIQPNQLLAGVTFDTEHEWGCLVLERPDDRGEFLALDSDGVRAMFHVAQVTRVQLAGEAADA